MLIGRLWKAKCAAPFYGGGEKAFGAVAEGCGRKEKEWKGKNGSVRFCAQLYLYKRLF